MVKIPDGWAETTLKNCITTNDNSIGRDFGFDKILYLDTGSITENKIDNLQEFAISEAPSRAKRLVKDGDIIYSTVRPNQKHFGFIKNPQKNLVVSTGFVVLSTKENADGMFIYYYITQDYITEKLHLIAEQAVSTYPSIKPENIENLQIYLPPLPEQQAIASVLSSLDDKIELLREENQTLEEMGQILFNEWFGKYKVGDELTDGWKVGKQKDLMNLLNGFAYKSSDFIEGGKYKLVTIANVQDGNFVSETKDSLDIIPDKMPEYCHLKTGDILLSLTGNVGRVCLVIGENYFLNQRVAKVTPKNEFDIGFSYFYFRQKQMITILESISVGTAQQNLSPIKTSELEMIIPSRESLDEFGILANSLYEKINKNNEEIQTLSTTRDQLLPKLMSGEVRVEF